MYKKLLLLTVIPVTPFLLLGLIRLLWFTAGAAWTLPATAAYVSLTFGIPLGILVARTLWDYI